MIWVVATSYIFLNCENKTTFLLYYIIGLVDFMLFHTMMCMLCIYNSGPQIKTILVRLIFCTRHVLGVIGLYFRFLNCSMLMHMLLKLFVKKLGKNTFLKGLHVVVFCAGEKFVCISLICANIGWPLTDSSLLSIACCQVVGSLYYSCEPYYLETFSPGWAVRAWNHLVGKSSLWILDSIGWLFDFLWVLSLEQNLFEGNKRR